ncbi:hypothetical protein [Pseudonocardia sp. T1-2H]|uniref:hypothetical protein n=1 Tax=Pseudonocardia sp. T1-2H TaxID=3128899 RepID=UPI003100DEF6
MPVVRLGNSQPINHATGAPITPDGQVTEVHIPDTHTLAQAISAVTHVGDVHFGVWAAHSAAEAPDWVWSDSEELAVRLAAHYGCPVGQPATDETPEG